MEKSVKVASIIAGSVVLIALLVYSVVLQVIPSNTVSVNGQAQLDVVPDVFVVNFDIQKKSSSASDAKDAVDLIYQDLKSSLMNLGIEESEIQTSSISVNPDYNWISGVRKQDGYLANHYVRVELSIEDRDLIGKIIDVGVETGSLISNINFELSEDLQREKKSEVIVLATQDAKLKAESMVEGLDKNLGRIISVSDSSFGYSPWPVFGAAREVDVAEAGILAKEAVSEIAPSEQIVYGNVRIVYKIK